MKMIIISISILIKVLKLKLFLKGCKLPLTSYVKASQITPNVCKMGKYLHNKGRESSLHLPALQATVLECLQICFPVPIQCHKQWLKESNSLFKCRLESQNSLAQLR